MTPRKLQLIIQLRRMRRNAAALGIPVSDMPLPQFYRQVLRADRVLRKAAPAFGITPREAAAVLHSLWLR